MLCLPGLGCKNYWEWMAPGSPVPKIECPSCHRLLRGHGWYRRYLGGQRVRIRRLWCAGCCVTHALLPEDVCAYQDLTLTALEAGAAYGAVQAKQRDGPTAGGRWRPSPGRA